MIVRPSGRRGRGHLQPGHRHQSVASQVAPWRPGLAGLTDRGRL